MKFTGVIFDFNGTLFRDSDKHEAAWTIVSENLRGKAFTGEELRTKMHGRTNRSIFEYLLGREVGERELAELTADKERIYRDLCLQDPAGLRLAPGASTLLDELARREVPMTIATASEANNVEFFIATFGLEKWFDRDRIVYDDGTFPGKPEPDIFLVAAGALGLAPARCVVFEDSASGLLSAHKAGIGRVVAVGDRLMFTEFVSVGVVDQVIGDFGEFDASTIA